MILPKTFLKLWRDFDPPAQSGYDVYGFTDEAQLFDQPPRRGQFDLLLITL